MKLKDFIAGLQKLEAAGHGEKQVFSCHGASGVITELSSAHVTAEVNETGPFDLAEGEEYISVYAGN